MFLLESFQDTLAKATSIFLELGIPFHLTGGITSIAYGEPRLTQDVDIVIDNELSRVNSTKMIEELIQKGFLLDKDSVTFALENKKLFQLLDPIESLKLDIYPRELIPGELSRSNTFELFEGVTLPIASREDVAVSKLIWIKKGSHKNRRDFRKIYLSSTKVEQNSIQLSAKNLVLTPLLEEVLSESDEILE